MDRLHLDIETTVMPMANGNTTYFVQSCSKGFDAARAVIDNRRTDTRAPTPKPHKCFGGTN